VFVGCVLVVCVWVGVRVCVGGCACVCGWLFVGCVCSVCVSMVVYVCVRVYGWVCLCVCGWVGVCLWGVCVGGVCVGGGWGGGGGGGWRLITVTRGIGIKLTKGKQKKKADGIKTRLLDTEPTYKRREWLCSKAAVKQSNNINDFHDSIVWIISEFLVYRYDPQFCVLKLSNFCKIWRSYSGDQQDHITEHNTHLLSILNVSVSYKKTC